MSKGIVHVVARLCARRRGDCIGMASAGAVFMAVPADAASRPVFYNMGMGMLAIGLAATVAAMAARRG